MNIKRLLKLNILTLLVCCLTFFGVTYAWFTAQVSNSGNKIISGTLIVDLIKVESDGSTESIATSNNPIFDDVQWYPGYYEQADLIISNLGTLPFRYEVIMTSTSEYNSDLNKWLNVYIDGYYVGKLDALFANNKALQTGTLQAKTKNPLTIKIEMDAGYSDNVSGLDSGSFDIQVLAYQVNSNDVLRETVQQVVVNRSEKVEVTNAQDTVVETEIAKVVLPANSLSSSVNDGDKVQLDVKVVIVDQVKESAPTPIPDPGNPTPAPAPTIAVINLDLTVGNTPITNFNEYITVTFIIPMNLVNVKVLYEGNELDERLVNYNPITGELSFKTDHFSEFVVTSTGLSSTVTTFEELVAAVADPQYQTIYVDGVIDATHTILIDRPLTIIGKEGNRIDADIAAADKFNVVIYSKKELVFGITSSNVRIENLTVDTKANIAEQITAQKNNYCTIFLVNGSSSNYLENIVLINNTMLNSGYTGIAIQNCVSPKVIGNTVDNFVDVAMKMNSIKSTESNPAVFSGNIMKNGKTENGALYIGNATNITDSYFVIENNQFYNIDRWPVAWSSDIKCSAIHIYKTNGNYLIKDNYIEDSFQGITIYKFQPNSINDRFMITGNTFVYSESFTPIFSYGIDSSLGYSTSAFPGIVEIIDTGKFSVMFKKSYDDCNPSNGSKVILNGVEYFMSDYYNSGVATTHQIIYNNLTEEENEE